MCHGGAGLLAGGEAEQYKRSSRYPINAVTARHESNVSTEAESHVAYCSCPSQRAISVWLGYS